MPYKLLEGLTMADIAFEATGKTLEDMFRSAAEAMTNTQIEDLRELEIKVEKKITLEAPDIERLLHDFLQELIYLKDADLLLFKKHELRIAQTSKGYSLTASLKGETIDMSKHKMLVDVKAVSWHKFKVEKTKSGWKAVVIIDV
ncbi:MAG: archease [Candidatus Micrarchaeota archaeon]